MVIPNGTDIQHKTHPVNTQTPTQNTTEIQANNNNKNCNLIEANGKVRNDTTKMSNVQVGQIFMQ